MGKGIYTHLDNIRLSLAYSIVDSKTYMKALKTMPNKAGRKNKSLKQHSFNNSGFKLKCEHLHPFTNLQEKHYAIKHTPITLQDFTVYKRTSKTEEMGKTLQLKGRPLLP